MAIITESPSSATKRYNVTSALTQELISAGDTSKSIRSVHFANVHDSSSVSVDLYIHNCGTNTYIIKNLSIPSGTSYVVDLSKIVIDTRKQNGDSLRMKCSSSDGIDVLLK